VPEPLKFDNKKDLVEAVLRESGNGADGFRVKPNDVMSSKCVAREWIASNTFRAFHHVVPPPSQLFREWAEASLDDPAFAQTIGSIRSQARFDDWHAQWCDSFAKHWTERSGNVMKWGPSRKLPDLLLLGVLCNWRSEGFDNDAAVSLSWFAHVPLDSYVLQMIRPHVLLDGAGKPRIPRNASMGWIPDHDTYHEIQRTIKDLCSEVGVPGVCLDFLAWGKAHS